MRRIIIMTVLALIIALPAIGAEGGKPSADAKSKPAPAKKYPKIVLYSTSWCPHCQEAREYFETNGIPYEDRDVEADPDAMDALMNKYKSQGVPVVVIGEDEKVLQGFAEKEFEQAVAEVKKKKK